MCKYLPVANEFLSDLNNFFRQLSIKFLGRFGDVGCKTTTTSAFVCSIACFKTSKVFELSLAKYLGLLITLDP